jgi:hypothetical protein
LLANSAGNFFARGILLALAVSNFDRCSPGLPDLRAAYSLEVCRTEAARSEAKPSCSQLEAGLFVRSLPDRSEAKQLEAGL